MASSSSKWRALQRRHKWSYDAVRLSPSRLQALINLEEKFRRTAPLFSDFLSVVLDLLQLTSTHAQVSALKKAISSFQALLSNHKTYIGTSARLAHVHGHDAADVDHCGDADGHSREVLSIAHGGNEHLIAYACSDDKYPTVFADADVGDYAVINLSFQLLVELLFMENSVPLHRSILSCLASLPPQWKEFIEKALAHGLQEYGILGPKTRCFALAAVATSLLNLPKPGLLKGIIEPFAATITNALSYDVQSLLWQAREGGRPTPTAMEDCQGALSSLYYMLVYYPHKLFTACSRPTLTRLNHIKRSAEETCSATLDIGDLSADGMSVSIYNAVLDVILDVLQTGYLSRDCCIAAGVGLCAAMQIEASHLDVASMLASSLFAADWEHSAILTEERGAIHGLKLETRIEAAISQIRGTTLAAEVAKFTEFGRLCVFRGLLTAISRPALNLKFLYAVNDNVSTMEAVNMKQEGKFSTWSVLYNGTLPALSGLCESFVDSHFKFHAVTALQICLQQIKTSISLGVTLSAYEVLESMACDYGIHVLPYSPLSNATVQRILQIVWNNWEDPLNQTVKQIQVVFDLLIDIRCLLLNGPAGSLSDSGEAEEVKHANNSSIVKDFLNSILRELLTAGGHRKGRYVPLASLSVRLGALNLLNLSPNLLFESINAMVDDDVCCSVGTFLKTFLERLREDCWSSEGGVMEGMAAFRRHSLPPIIAGMVSGNSKLRVNINIYALPIVLQIDSDAIFPMLAFVLDGILPNGGEEKVSWHELRGAFGLPELLNTNQRVALMIGLLKTARTEALIEGDLCYPEDYASSDLKFKFSSIGMAFVSIKRVVFRIPLALLEIAVTHSEDSLRIDAAEALCLNPKTASMPSYLELALLKVSIPLNMRCSSTSFRMKWTSLFRKFFLRTRVSVERQLKADASKGEAEQAEGFKSLLEDSKPTCIMPVSVQQMQSFMGWFCNMLLFSIYPSAPYERKSMSMELIAAMLESWSLTNVSLHSVGTHSFLSSDATTVLLGSIVDSWDKLREGAFKILSSYPTPLPGYKSTIEVEKVVSWAMSLVNSPRVRESDAGALALRLVFQKYVVQLGWTIKLHPQPVATCPKLLKNEDRAVNEGIAIAEFLNSLNDWLESGIEEGEKNLVKACRHIFVHGALLSYRYTIEELDWKSTSMIAAASELRIALDRLLNLLTRVTAIALWVVSADAFDMSQGLNVSSKPSNIDLQGLLEDDEKLAINDWDELASEHTGDEEFGFLAPSEQAIMVGCWLAMKEVSLLLGTVTRKVPLPGYDTADVDEHGKSFSMLDLNQLELIGGHFLQVLLSMKHNGAIDKTRAGFVALCNRLLCSSDSRLNKMPELWLHQLMDHTAAKGQIVDDLLRRSAGIPAAFLALFLSEPEGTPKRLLIIAMRWLIDLVKAFLEGSHLDNIAAVEKGPAASSFLLKARDEGVVPTVHAFNVMRVTFNDTNLSTDCSGFCAEGLSVAIQAFSSCHWEVRNAAVLAFTALLRRMVGFLNNQTHESARRAMTGFEFFHRYPSLHFFLLKELQNATLQLEDENEHTAVGSGNLSRTLHPSLAPVLIILSRLKPSIINTDKDDWLSPSAFTSYISKCATQSNLKIHSLLMYNCATLPSNSNLRKEIISLLLPILKSVDKHSIFKCPMVGAAFLQVLESLSRVDNMCRTRAIPNPSQDHFVESSALVVDGLFDNSCHKVAWDPTNVIMKAKACKSYFEGILTNWHLSASCEELIPLQANSPQPWMASEILARLKDCLYSIMYEIRLAVLKVLKGFFDLLELKLSMPDSVKVGLQRLNWAANFIHPLLVERLKTEMHPRCLRYMLLNHFTYSMLQLKIQRGLVDFITSSNMGDNPSGFWSRLSETKDDEMWRLFVQVYNNSKHGKTREIAICCLGLCIQQITQRMQKPSTLQETFSCLFCQESSTSCSLVVESMQSWLGIIWRHGMASEPVMLRRATADAIIASGILEQVRWVGDYYADRGSNCSICPLEEEHFQHSNLCGGQEKLAQGILDVWYICMKLLEDEDLVLREKLAVAVLHIVSPISDTRLSHNFVPAQVERVIHLSSKFLSLHLSHTVEYVECLATWIWRGLTDMNFIEDDCNLVRRLFDKEADNHHEEGLFFMQLCFWHIHEAMSSSNRASHSSSSSLSKVLELWRQRFLEHLRSFIGKFLSLESKLQWLGGITNHPDVFKALYPLLLGLMVFSGPVDRTAEGCSKLVIEERVTEIVQVFEMLKTFVTNPLILNLLMILMRQHGIQESLVLGVQENLLSESFDPFFLL
ncbi:hypothetical protein GOP47_0008177 [Adiantum capillus-veneris]|uniref:DUF2428 domain-containing protein n=1 Tax=Adiantum capillus-veneris TaxID=13818 RepID=A0A9D4UYJ1_ADICA|nr:hypothetical protein GOP47_0008177 [Adiantum capillus-veneris]